MRVASFNLFWFGTRHPRRAPRGPEDLGLLRQVLDRLDAHVLALQEVVDVGLLQRVLDDRWRSVDDEGRAICSPDIEPSGAPERLKLAMAWDADVLELRGTEQVRLRGGAHFRGRRPPLVAHLEHRATGWRFSVVAAHLKAGPHTEPGGPEATTRDQECRRLAEWLGEHRGHPVLLAGDLNAQQDHSSLRALRAPPLDGFHWHPAAHPGEAWTTWRERLVIDHILLSPPAAERLLEPAQIYAFDQDPALDDDERGLHYLRRIDGHFAEPGRDAHYQAVENLYRVSDHRPVYVDLTTS